MAVTGVTRYRTGRSGTMGTSGDVAVWGGDRSDRRFPERRKGSRRDGKPPPGTRGPAIDSDRDLAGPRPNDKEGEGGNFRPRSVRRIAGSEDPQHYLVRL